MKLVGKTISHFEILEILGEGGMGKVYKARDTTLNRVVALKFFPKSLLSDEINRKRFYREAQAISALDHPNIMTIYDIYETDGEIFLAMACIEGELFHDRIKRKLFKPIEIIKSAIQVAEGLHATHTANIIHRDIKSENLITGKDGRVTILDFGLAKHLTEKKITKESSTLGTLSYMSPEQIQGMDVDYRTDLWSLGVVMYQMATSKMPFSETHDPALMYSILNEEPIPVCIANPNIPEELGRIIHKLLQKSPDQRYQHADDVVADLKALKRMSEPSIPQMSNAEIPPYSKSPGKWKLKVFSSITLLALSLVLLNFFGIPLLDKTSHQEAQISSIAVLPFTSISSNQESVEFSVGLHDDILANLASIKSLHVASRTSVMPFKNSDKSLTEIASALNVNTILEGSVRKSGNRIRIVAQLIDAKTNNHLWAETYDRDMEDVFTIQTEIAKNIASVLKINLAEEDSEIEIPTKNIKAYENYIKGKYLYYECKTWEEFLRAGDFFREAARLDSSFYWAYLWIADVELTGYNWNRPNSERSKIDNAYKLLELAEKHGYKSNELYLNYIKWRETGNWHAWRDYRLAHQDTSNAGNMLNNGRLVEQTGDPVSAQKYFKKSVELGPEILYAWRDYGINAMRLEQYDLAKNIFNKFLEKAVDTEGLIKWYFRYLLSTTDNIQAIENEIDSLFIGRSGKEYYSVKQLISEYDRKYLFALNYMSLSNDIDLLKKAEYHLQLNNTNIAKTFLDSARNEFEKELSIEPKNAYAHAELGVVYAYLNMDNLAIQEGNRALELWPIDKHLGFGEDMIYINAVIHSIIGNNDQALDHIETLLKGYTIYKRSWFTLHYYFDPLRNEPRFKKLMGDQES